MMAMSEWRPDGWKDRKENALVATTDSLERALQAVSFETGADAILAAIWKMARESCTGTFVFDTHYWGDHAILYDPAAIQQAGGPLAFTPDAPLPFADIGDDQETGEHDASP